MTGYSYASGVYVGVTTSRCPVCLAVRVHSTTDQTAQRITAPLCCCELHQKQWALMVEGVERQMCIARHISKRETALHIARTVKRSPLGLLFSTEATRFLDDYIRQHS